MPHSMEYTIMVNFKMYREASGARAVELARHLQRAQEETGIKFVAIPSTLDLLRVAEAVDIDVYAQHADPVRFGAHTGSISVEALADAGIPGLLINHSEKRLKLADIGYLVSEARRLGMTSVVCTNDDSVSRAAAALEPTYVAMEPPELIGGDVSVSKAKPDVVRRTVDAVRAISPRVHVLIGAGVKNAEDVRIGKELGAVGILVASGVVKAKDPLRAAMDLASGFL